MFTLAQYLGQENNTDAAELTLFAQHKLNAGQLTCEQHIYEEMQRCKRVGINLLDEVHVMDTDEVEGQEAEQRLLNACNAAAKTRGVCILHDLDMLRTYYWKDGKCVMEKQGFVKEGGGEYTTEGNLGLTAERELFAYFAK